MESGETEQEAAQLYRAQAAGFAQLSITNRNIAEWDDAADFVTSRNPGFLTSNFTAPAFGELHIDLAWILDKRGESLFSGLYNRAAHTLASPAPDLLLAQIANVLRADEHGLPKSAAGELVQTSSGPMAISVWEITRTDRSAPTGALMVAGRLLGGEEIARAAETSQMPVALTMIANAALGAQSLPNAVLQWVQSERAPDTFSYERSPDVIEGYALIRDYRGIPLAVLSTQHRRDIYALGLRTTRWLLGIIAFAFMIFISVLLGLSLRLHRTLLDYEAARHRPQRLVRPRSDMALLAQPLRDALRTPQLALSYEPIFDLKTGRLAAFEALPVWEHPELGKIKRETFLDAADEGHLMPELCSALLEMALEDLKRWGASPGQLVPVVLGLSAQQFEQANFADFVTRACKDAEVQQNCIQFQLPESTFVEQLERIRPGLEQLRRSGHKLLMDKFTFSAGHSIPWQLARVPVDGIRLAAELLDDGSSVLTRVPIIRAVLELSRTAGLTTIANGVHTAEQLAVLIEQGCELAQGRFLGGVLAAKDVEEMLSHTQGHVIPSDSMLTRSLRRR
jgi:EAL domain-containing protein (putative c-di-GMP-specific phosphodiesterase class I)/sensor domain CHASE-containing protein